MRNMQNILDAAFDNLICVALDSQQRALDSLLALMASCCPSQVSAAVSNDTNAFLDLQDLFEYNITTRLLIWLSGMQNKLFDTDNEIEFTNNLILQGFAILQGLALIHQPSKLFMGRKATLQMLVTILSKSRQHSNQLDDPSTSRIVSLACAVLDTLLCILVDCSQLIRTFESVDGIETVVKLLKRNGTARSVRMKCLEFLYFYLMDESSTKDVSAVLDKEDYRTTDAIPPKTPTKKNPNFAVAQAQTRQLTNISGSSPTRSRVPSSPTKRAVPNSYTMLQSELDDFIPITPKKPSRNTSMRDATETPPIPKLPVFRNAVIDPPTKWHNQSSTNENQPPFLLPSPPITEKNMMRTTREKKEILSTFLGNVDALVEGVERVGVFGLS